MTARAGVCGLGLAAAAILMTGCGHRGHSTVMTAIGKAEAASANGGLTSLPQLDGVKREPAAAFKDVPQFEVVARTAAMKKAPCEKCHDKPLEVLKRAPEGKKASHWDVKLEHAAEETMSCATCHLKTDLNKLATLAGKPVSLNHAYQVCSQCHHRQVADWAGGAHGKRAGGWAPPRAVQSCPACHDPHKPKLAPRWPAMSQRRDARFDKSQEAQ